MHCDGDAIMKSPIMKKLGLSALSVGAALVCAVMPLSFHWSPTKVVSISVDEAEARLGQRPSIARNVAAVGQRAQRRAYRATAGAAVGAAAPGTGTNAYAAGSSPPPNYGPGYGVVGYNSAPAGAIVDPVTGRWCTTELSGYQWCWTP